MLGRSWEQENRKRAISYLQDVRTLSNSGFRDSLNLSVASLGYEARRAHARKALPRSD